MSAAGFGAVIEAGFMAPAEPIEVDVDAATMARLTERIRRQWTKLGEDEPHWSVITQDRYRAAALDPVNRAAFRRSGEQGVRVMDAMAERAGIVPHGICVELGCGVGRITEHLAGRFDRVIGIDISPGNVALCDAGMAAAGRTNVETRLIVDSSGLDAVPPYDFLFSMLVLQHNPPPIQRDMLRRLLARIRPGGAAIFQLIADLPGYRFVADEYLASPEPVMEIHSLPMPALFDVLTETGMTPRLMRMAPGIDAYGSYAVAAAKP